MYTNRGETAVVLLVDDDPADQELTRRALEQHDIPMEIHAAQDGQEALEYLTRQGRFSHPDDSPKPDLILLDLNMPRVDGHEFLTWLRSSSLRQTPVVVLTTSQQEQDIVASYNIGCNSYLTKPVRLDEFLNVVRSLGLYWFDLVTLPPGDSR